MISDICPKEECIGCALCENVCPQDAISIEIKEGFYRPVINNKCISCALCISKCLANTKEIKKNQTPDIAYAAWCKDECTHYESSSGGLAYKIAYNFIEAGGSVIGVWYNPGDRTIEHRIYNTVQNLNMMRGSRYVHSKKDGIYRLVEKILKEKDVLFIGMPCEVYAMKSFLSDKQFNNQLFTIDLLCRGGASPKCLQDHISEIVHDIPIADVRFRGGKNDCRFTIWDKKGKRIFMCGQYYDAYFWSFMKRSIYQQACYKCRFAGPERVGDLTLGDYWGLDTDVTNTTSVRGINMLLVNDKNGKKLVESIYNDITLIERPIDEAIHGNDTLREPTKKPEEYNELWININKNGFHKALKKIYGFDWRKKIISCYTEMIKTKIKMIVEK